MMTAVAANVSRPPSRDEVVRLVGDVDDAVVAAIVATGATYIEIEEAVNWLSGDPEGLARLGRSLSPAAQAVCDILAADPMFAADEEHAR
jgi:hypothetical protein